MDAAFQQAAQPHTPKVLGLRLQPLTIGHLHTLRKYNSAFVCDESPTFDDLLLSVFICAHSWVDADKNLSSWWLKLYIKLWSFRIRAISLGVEIATFQDYLSQAFNKPKTAAKAKSRPVETPIEWGLVVSLMTDLGMSKSDAMNEEVSKALCLLTAFAERSGVVEILDPRRAAFVEAVRQFEQGRGVQN